MADDRETRIRDAAYRLWKEDGEPHGRDRDHWQQAEREVEGREAGIEPDPQTAINAVAPDVPEQPASSPQEEAPAPAPKAAGKKPATRRKRTT